MIRKAISSIRSKDIAKIVDEGVRRAVERRMSECGNKDAEFEKSVLERPVYVDEKCLYPIKTLRVFDEWSDDSVAPVKKDCNGRVIGYSVKRNNQHIALYLAPDGKMKEYVLSFWDAVARKRFGLPIVVTDTDGLWDKISNSATDYPEDVLSNLPTPGLKFVMSMQSNEMFVLGLSDDEFDDAVNRNDKALLASHLYRVQTLSTKDYRFRLHTQAKMGEEVKDKRSKMLYRIQSIEALKSLNPRKVRVTQIGEIIPV